MKYFIFFLLLFTLKLFGQSSGGSLGSNTIVCQGNNNGVLSVSGYSGTIQRWEYALSSTGPWTPLIFTASSYNYINLNQSTYFRVVVQLLGYPEANSNTVFVNCDFPTVSGTISTNTFQCINSTGSATLSGNTGSVLSWEASTNNWISTTTITTSNTLIATLPSLTNTTQIRAHVQNGVCPAAYSNTIIVNPAAQSNGGIINGSQSVCAISNASTLTLTNFTGTIQQWESASSVGGPYNIIASSANTNTTTYVNLSQNTWYRVLVKNGTCIAATSQTFSIHVDQPSSGGSIAGTQNVCAGMNTGTLQLLANTGQIDQWEYSNNGTNWTVVNNATPVQTFSNLASSVIYRAIVQNGLCPAATSSSFIINVSPAPTVTFNTLNVCKLSSISFTNFTSGSNIYTWDFGDLGSSNNYNPSHSYVSDGTFNVKLTVTSSLGCIDSLKKTITIYPAPVASIFSSDTACYGNTLLFSNSSTIISGNISTLKFNFNDGSPGSSISPSSHFFTSAGSYSVYLIVTSNFGCKDSTLKLISIFPKPNCNFAVSNVCKGSPILLNNLSLIANGSLQHYWNFGNGNFSTLNSPAYNYPNAGTYTVSLISSSSHNCFDTLYKSITINERPDISFTATSACLGSCIIFSSTISPSTVNVSLTVNYGDGTTSESATSSHNYLTSGTFASSIIAVTDSGCVSSTSKNITVYSRPFANFNVNNVCNADSVRFNNTSSIANGSMTYTWNLSNGTSTLNSPSSLYSLPGNYRVTLIATSNFDCSDTAVKSITIFDAPKAEFNFSNACNGFPVTFTNNTTVNTGVISSSFWNFGDNSTASVVNPSHDYLNNGTYTVTLISTSSNGCSDTVKKNVHVFEGPLAKFSAQPQCQNTAITFTNQSILSIGTYSSSWNFGDETFSEQNSPAHLYSKDGSNKVWLKVTSSDLCTDSTSLYIETFLNPKISAGKDTTLDKGLGITLNANGALNYVWFPSAGLSNSLLKNPFSNPDSTTTYIIEGTDENGCKGTDTVIVKINDSFLVTPFNILTPDGNGKNDTWIVKNIQAYKENKVVIFDQWNQKVYEKANYNNEWEGKNSGGEILPDATYYYILTFSKSPKKYSGYITLIRNK